MQTETAPALQEFRLALKDGTDETVKGYRGRSIGVHEIEPGCWRVTHLPSGFAVINWDLDDAAQALELLELLDPILPDTGGWREAPERIVQKRAYFLAKGWWEHEGYGDGDEEEDL